MRKHLDTIAKEFDIDVSVMQKYLRENGINFSNTSISDETYGILEKEFQKKILENDDDDNNLREVEKEDNSNVVMNIPFNPNDIRVRTIPHTIGQLIDRLEYSEINLNTEFQRLPNLWNPTKKSRFIESLILKLPIPTFFFAESKKSGVWDVVDGLQRVSTLKQFIVNKEDERLKLTNLEFLKEYNGKTFTELPRSIQRRIKTFPITIYIVEKGTPDVVKYNIFSRLNQGGLILKSQEIRHAIHQGVAADLVADLVRAKDISSDKKATEEGLAFVEATGHKIKSKRMLDRDFANRFVSFYLISYKDYEPDLDSFMNKGLTAIKKLSDEEIIKLKSDFKAAMILAKDIFGDDAFRKRFSIDDRRKPINKALFEILSVTFAKLSNEEKVCLVERKKIFKEKLQMLHNPGSRFLNAISYGTAQKESVEQRFKDIERIIKETLSND